MTESPMPWQREELVLKAEVTNQYGQDHSANVKLLSGEETIEVLPLTLKAVKRRVSFSPYVPEKSQAPSAFVWKLIRRIGMPIPPTIPIPS